MGKDHWNIAQYIGFYITTNEIIVMHEYCHLGDLAHVLARERTHCKAYVGSAEAIPAEYNRFPMPTVLDWITQILHGMHWLHLNGTTDCYSEDDQ